MLKNFANEKRIGGLFRGENEAKKVPERFSLSLEKIPEPFCSSDVGQIKSRSEDQARKS